jgi:hypothetical protein
MKATTRASVVSVAAVYAVLGAAPVVTAQQCPPEVNQAKSRIAAVTKSTPQAKAPRAMAGARAQDQQAPRGQDQQAPRAQDQQAPRGQDQQAPRAQDQQAPRAQDQQAPRAQDQQAPRAQDQQAPRAQDQQAPRAQDQQAPRAQDQQAPRAQDQQAPRTPAGARGGDVQAKIERAQKLVSEAEQLCKAGNMAGSTEKARAALDALK